MAELQQPSVIEENITPQTVVAVVVSFQPDIESLIENIEQINSQVDVIVLVDNHSALQEEIFEQVSLAHPDVKCIGLSENAGVGFAQNKGIQYAREIAADYVLLLDQDSKPTANMVAKLKTAVNQINDSEGAKVAAVGPRYKGAGRNDSFFIRFGWFKFERHYCDPCEYGVIPCDFLISSGALISMQVLDEIGDMDSELFIDHVDTEWFLRAKSKGLQSYGVCDAIMEHSLGEKTHQVRLFGLGRVRLVPEHKPFRYYYMFRNSILLYKRRYCSRLWVWNDLQRLLQILFFYGFCVGERKQNLHMMCLGIRHGLSNVTGRQDF